MAEQHQPADPFTVPLCSYLIPQQADITDVPSQQDNCVQAANVTSEITPIQVVPTEASAHWIKSEPLDEGSSVDGGQASESLSAPDITPDRLYPVVKLESLSPVKLEKLGASPVKLAEVPPPKRRGRPRKDTGGAVKSLRSPIRSSVGASGLILRKRGRPRKVPISDEESPDASETDDEDWTHAPLTSKRRRGGARGRPSGRGRRGRGRSLNSSVLLRKAVGHRDNRDLPVARRGRGRPPKSLVLGRPGGARGRGRPAGTHVGREGLSSESEEGGSSDRAGQGQTGADSAEYNPAAESDVSSDQEYRPPVKCAKSSNRASFARKVKRTHREREWKALGAEARLLHLLLTEQDDDKILRSVLSRLATVLELVVSHYFDSLTLQDVTLNLKKPDPGAPLVMLPLKALLGALARKNLKGGGVTVEVDVVTKDGTTGAPKPHVDSRSDMAVGTNNTTTPLPIINTIQSIAPVSQNVITSTQKVPVLPGPIPNTGVVVVPPGRVIPQVTLKNVAPGFYLVPVTTSTQAKPKVAPDLPVFALDPHKPANLPGEQLRAPLPGDSGSGTVGRIDTKLQPHEMVGSLGEDYDAVTVPKSSPGGGSVSGDDGVDSGGETGDTECDIPSEVHLSKTTRDIPMATGEVSKKDGDVATVSRPTDQTSVLKFTLLTPKLPIPPLKRRGRPPMKNVLSACKVNKKARAHIPMATGEVSEKDGDGVATLSRPTAQTSVLKFTLLTPKLPIPPLKRRGRPPMKKVLRACKVNKKVRAQGDDPGDNAQATICGVRLEFLRPRCFICDYKQEAHPEISSYTALLDHVVERHQLQVGASFRLNCPTCGKSFYATSKQGTPQEQTESIMVRLLHHLTGGGRGAGDEKPEEDGGDMEAGAEGPEEKYNEHGQRVYTGHGWPFPEEYLRSYPCHLCPARLVTWYLLNRHHSAKHEPRWRCDKCGKSYGEHYKRKHMSICGKGKDVRGKPCPVCNKKRVRLREHMLLAHSGGKRLPRPKPAARARSRIADVNAQVQTPCETCGVLFRRCYLAKHKQMCGKTQDSRKKVCPLCKKRVVRMDTHLRFTHSDASRTLCHVCSQSFKIPKSLELHLINKHGINESGNELLSCDKCAFKCAAKQDLKSHLNHHATVSCPHCFAVVSKSQIYCHIKCNHENGEKIPCKVCGVLFKNRHTLRNHEQTLHNKNAKKYKCPWCVLITSTKTYLRKHMRERCPNRNSKVAEATTETVEEILESMY